LPPEPPVERRRSRRSTLSPPTPRPPNRQPPVQRRSEWGITDLNLAVEYLGTNLQLTLQVEKTSLFKFDKQTKLIFDLQQFRASSPAQLMEFMREKIDELMQKKPAS